MTTFARYDKSVAFLRKYDRDWAALIKHVGPCLHDPKAAREPYEALIRAIGCQQLTAKAGDAIIARLKALHPDVPFPMPEHIIAADFDTLRTCGFSASKIATIKGIAEATLSGLVPPRQIASEMGDEELIDRIMPSKASDVGLSKCCSCIRWSGWTSFRLTISVCARAIVRSSRSMNSRSRKRCARSARRGRLIEPWHPGIFGACRARAAMSSNSPASYQSARSYLSQSIVAGVRRVR